MTISIGCGVGIASSAGWMAWLIAIAVACGGASNGVHCWMLK